MSRDKKGETIGNWADCLLNPVKHALEVADLKKKKSLTTRILGFIYFFIFIFLQTLWSLGFPVKPDVPVLVGYCALSFMGPLQLCSC